VSNPLRRVEAAAAAELKHLGDAAATGLSAAEHLAVAGVEAAEHMAVEAEHMAVEAEHMAVEAGHATRVAVADHMGLAGHPGREDPVGSSNGSISSSTAGEALSEMLDRAVESGVEGLQWEDYDDKVMPLERQERIRSPRSRHQQQQEEEERQERQERLRQARQARGGGRQQVIPLTPTLSSTPTSHIPTFTSPLHHLTPTPGDSY
jgi:hypothetical protein